MFVLARFPETQPIADAARSSLVRIWHTVEQQVVHAIPGLIAIILIVVAGRFLTRLTTDLFTAIERGTVRIPAVHPETAHATRRLNVVLIWVMAVVVAYPLVPGSRTDAFKGVSVFLGLLATLRSTRIVGHTMSGLVLVYSRALRKGDIVRVNDLTMPKGVEPLSKLKADNPPVATVHVPKAAPVEEEAVLHADQAPFGLEQGEDQLEVVRTPQPLAQLLERGGCGAALEEQREDPVPELCLAFRELWLEVRPGRGAGADPDPAGLRGRVPAPRARRPRRERRLSADPRRCGGKSAFRDPARASAAQSHENRKCSSSRERLSKTIHRFRQTPRPVSHRRPPSNRRTFVLAGGSAALRTFV